jgi:hypothetical protein
VSLGETPADNHVVVMSGKRLVHDPAADFPVPPGCKVAPVIQIDQGITFDPIGSGELEDYPARVRIVVDEDDGDAQLGLIWSIRNRHYSSAATAATRFEAEALNPLDTAARAALSGASGGTVVTHGTLSTNWTPVLDMRVGGTAYPTHTGTNRLWVRYRTTSGTAVQLRAVWDVGDLVFPVENRPWRHPTTGFAGTAFFMADLGELRLDPPPVGPHRWNGIIQAKGDVGGENVSIDKVEVLNADEGYGVLRAPVRADPGLTAYTARDGFDQTAGPLTGKVAPVGGTWTVVASSDADDFAVETAGHTVQRTALSDALVGSRFIGRLVTAGTGTLAAVVVQTDIKVTATGGAQQYVAARVVDINNFAWAGWDGSIDKWTVDIAVGGVWAVLASTPATRPTEWTTIRLYVDAAGRFYFWAFPQGGHGGGDPLLAGQRLDLATGALAAGKYGYMT